MKSKKDLGLLGATCEDRCHTQYVVYQIKHKPLYTALRVTSSVMSI